MTTLAPHRPARLRTGGRSWHIDRLSLRPVIDDLAAFREEFIADPARDALEALWLGRPSEALAFLDALIDTTAPSVRLRALRADALRDQGRYAEAVRTYRELIEEMRGHDIEATLHQHLGKVFFAAGQYTEAIVALTRAAELRIANGADSDLLESTMQAMARVAEVRDATNRAGGVGRH